MKLLRSPTAKYQICSGFSQTKVWDIVEKRLHWASVVRGSGDNQHFVKYVAAI